MCNVILMSDSEIFIVLNSEYPITSTFTCQRDLVFLVLECSSKHWG